MKKTRQKPVEANKGNSKIFNFFHRSIKDIEPSPKLGNVNASIKCIVLDDSDDDFADKPSKSDWKDVPDKENILGEAKDNHSLMKRKIDEFSEESPPAKKINIQEKPLSPNPQTSTREYVSEGIVTPSKHNKQIIFIRSPESLLSNEALREYHTPEKEFERFLDKIHTPSPRKLLFNECSDSSKVDEISIKSKQKIKTPKKTTPKKECSTSKMTNRNEFTPNKTKRTPKKLFEKSPNNVNEFNVQLMNDFVKITPSKNSVSNQTEDVVFVRSSEKRQSSILKYVSPVASANSLRVQEHNESTPMKEIQNEFKTPTDKVKTKLNFEDCQGTMQTTKEFQGKCSNNGQDVLPNFSDFDDGWDDFVQDAAVFDLDLTESQHCKIIGINPFPLKSVLTLKSTKTGEKAICNLQDFWIHTRLAIGDIVHASAKKIDNNEWLIDNEHGLLVFEPDLLISTTSVVGSLFCKRKCLLSERYRGFEPTNQVMIIGSLIHNLLQYVLRNKVNSQGAIEKAAKDMVRQRRVIKDLYHCEIPLELIESEVMKFVPKIQHFMNLYVTIPNKNSHLKHNKDDWKGTISSVDDIEENIWCPELGVKGKVDVSIKTGLCSMPLELKTGRATVSLEHRGQVMLYIMMMRRLGYEVPSGLLLYLREGVLKDISASQKENRDLIMLRNELAYYLTRKPKIVESEGEHVLFPPEIPEPINHSACQKCPYNVICASHAKYSNEDISSNKVLRNIQNDALVHLQPSHLNYFMKWVSLLSLEANSDKSAKDVREIYTLTPQEREIQGKCIINLKATTTGDECDGVYGHTFQKLHADSNSNFLANGIMEGNYVVVSTDSRPAVAAGFVTDITAISISVSLDRNLLKKYPNKTFHIDTYNSSNAQSYNFASLTLLLELSPRGEELRKIIIDKSPPTFKTTLPKFIGTKGKHILKRLNIVQQRAVLKALAANEYFLIRGMPGTGKTSTIVALIQLLYELNKSVLITSHTHSAVDNVCVKLLSFGVKLLRLGSESKMHPKLKEYSEHSLTKHCTTPQQLEEVYNSARILAVTCLGSGHPVLTKRQVDICIVDESTQVLQSSVIRPLYCAKTFILIGDPDQLPAVVKNSEARNLGMCESLFERLYREDATVALNLNYRMNSVITALANAFTYDGNLLIGNEQVANATYLRQSNKEVPQVRVSSPSRSRCWISTSLDDSLEKAVQFLDTGPVWNLQYSVPWFINRGNGDSEGSQTEMDSAVNIYEAAITVNLIKALLKADVQACQIGVIATYRSQVAQISALIKTEHVDVSTVDRFQGKDKSVIIYSCGKSRDVSIPRSVNKFELLEDTKRLTVAITRAKHKLIIIGDVQTLVEYSTFRKLVSLIGENVVRLSDTEGFDWGDVLQLGE